MFSMLSNQKLKNSIKSHEFTLLIVNLLFISLLSVFTKGKFIQPENLGDMLVAYAPAGIMAPGVLLVIISGGIDISFMAVATVAQYLAALFMLKAGGNIASVCLVAALAGMILGCLNALLVHNLKAPTIIVTIATMNLFYGVLMWISRGKWLYGFPAWFADKPGFSGLFIPIAVLLAVFLLCGLILRFTRMGRCVMALGANVEAAKRVGVRVLKTRIFVYAFMGFSAGIAALIQAYIVQNVAPNSLVGREMEVLAMVVLGGAALNGGSGTAFGTLLGVLLVAMIGNGLVLLEVSSYWHSLCMGVVILLSFCLTGIRSMKKPAKEIRV